VIKPDQHWIAERRHAEPAVTVYVSFDVITALPSNVLGDIFNESVRGVN
jgi:hypothetical protein